ncbi:hypothetical protein LCGC14_3066690, partial [marine sediment metagenome]
EGMYGISQVLTRIGNPCYISEITTSMLNPKSELKLLMH